MTSGEKNIVRSLIAVAWADGRMESAEASVIEGLLVGFDASDEEEAELLAYAEKRRTLEADIPLAELNEAERELLFANAALLTQADGDTSKSERAVLDKLGDLLELDAATRKQLLASGKAPGK